MNKIVILILFYFYFMCQQSICEEIEFDQDELRFDWKNHIPNDVEDHKLSKIIEMTNLANFNKILDNIVIPRVVGSNCHKEVKKYLIDTMINLKWTVETDKFDDYTPIKKKLTFENIIATHNSQAKRFLVFACHYDSKNFTDFQYEGASDSAVSCAMMIDLATVLTPYLEQQQKNLSLKFIFFDGKEAFYNWSSTDSIYGARHLAEKWENENYLLKIDMMVLLDLLGTPNPIFYSYYFDTEEWFMYLCNIQTQFNNLGLLKNYVYSGVAKKDNSKMYFQPHSLAKNIEDDHTPFLQRGVPILYIIPADYPDTWHTPNDNRESIDLATVDNLNQILRMFVIRYFHLEI